MNRLFIPTFLVFSTLAGCGGAPDAQFVPGEQTLELIPEARKGFKAEDGAQIKGVRQWVDELFGTPSDLIAWRRLPVDFGGVAGSVVSVDAPDALAGFTVNLEETLESVEAANLTWITGDKKGETVEVRFDSAGMKVTEVSDLPKVGDTFVLNAGHLLQSGRKLYMEHCVHCHGTSGDGKGPTAKYLNPRPRDYRLGKFKFKSTVGLGKPTRADLERIIRHGIPGTYMPSFMLLEDEESKAIVEYVRWLAMRGELEQRLATELAGEYSLKAVKEILADGSTTREEHLASLKETLIEWAGDGTEDNPGFVSETADELVETWTDAEEAVINPSVARVEDTEESRKLGRELYLTKAKCVDCHGNAAKGNGTMTRAYEKNDAKGGELFGEPGLHDPWGFVVKPRDLTSGIYRGGRRPLDIYRRIRGGILVSKMPPFSKDTLSDEQVWHIVNYVLSIPLEGK